MLKLCGTFSFTTSLTVAMLSTGMIVKHVGIDYNPRIGTSHVNLFRDTLRSLQVLIQAIVLFNPIKAFLSLAIVPLTIMIIFLMMSIIFTVYWNLVWLLFSLFCLLYTSFVCFLLLSFGMLAYSSHRNLIDRI